MTITLRGMRVKARHAGASAVVNAWASALLLVCAAGGLVAQTPSGVVSAHESFLSGLPGVRFEWATVKGGSERGAILVPVEIAGENLKYQLDMGADTTVLYGTDLASKLGWTKGRFLFSMGRHGTAKASTTPTGHADSLQGAFIPRGGRAITDFSSRMTSETCARLGAVAGHLLAIPDAYTVATDWC